MLAENITHLSYLTAILKNNMHVLFSKYLPNLCKIKYNIKMKPVNVSNIFFHRKHNFSLLYDKY